MMRRLAGPAAHEQQAARAVAMRSIAHPSDPVGWLDSTFDGATCGEPVPIKQSAAQKRAAEAKQRAIVQAYRSRRCSG